MGGVRPQATRDSREPRGTLRAIPCRGRSETGMESRTCGRVALSTESKRRLWSESGGYCQNPSCARALFADGSDIDFAEMAPIIPATTHGRRDVPVDELSAQERAHHTNIVVLCANCHTVVDKDPDSHPAELMRKSKQRHKDLLERVLGTPRYSDRREARQHIAPLLEENGLIHRLYAPRPGAFSEAAAERWRGHMMARIIPNNRTIRRVLERNRHLLTGDELDTLAMFALHALELEHRHLLNDWTAESTRFPERMSSILDLKP
jgi:hypothetical protein